MFKSARLKLTVWYLLIIILVSSFFSFFIYQVVSLELNRSFRQAEARLERRPEFQTKAKNGAAKLLLLEDLNAAKSAVRLRLFHTNMVIWLLSALAAYFLAGKTLHPIEEALEEQKRFVADASHELRTPITALKTSMEVNLRDKNLSTESKKILKDNLEEVDQLQDLANSLLNLAQYQRDNGSLLTKKLDLKKVIKDAIKQVKPLAKKKKIEIKLISKKQVLSGDRAALTKLFIIFLDNAIKFSPKEGEVSINVKRLNKRKKVVVEIKDTGVGIAKKDLNHIFDRFYQADRSRCKSKCSGFGLGLALAKRIIHSHKASISVNSKLGKGSTFIIQFPLSKV
ncbi:MAG: HAMP domain-containing sensor histidine kinase [Candidatus Woesebacteria bacterium]|jgi:signal transduction histidine kinase